MNEQIEPGLTMVHLFIASDAVADAIVIDGAYDIVIDAAPKVGGYGNDAASVKVITGDDPSVSDAIWIRVAQDRRSRVLARFLSAGSASWR